ncbi:MAG: alpha/beta fold hydrolase [Desulfobacterales bacterium]|nr:alpha/beta fold hydrolase [Desulfobacterales bacterium]
MGPDISEHPIRMGDGTRSVLTVFRNETSAPVVICMPAMGVRAAFYEPLATNLCLRGLNVATADLRGLGASSVRVGRGTDFGYHDMLTHDWPAVLDAVHEGFPPSRTFLLGHSLGGQLSALYASLFPERVAGLVLVASCSVYYKGWSFPANWGIWLGTQTAGLLAALLGYFPGRRVGFGGTAARTVIRDWARNTRTGRYDLTNSPHDFEARLASLRRPVLAVSIPGDGFAPPRAVDNLCRKFPNAPLTRWHVPPGELAPQGLDHFGWVQHSGPIADRIAAWVATIRLRGHDRALSG